MKLGRLFFILLLFVYSISSVFASNRIFSTVYLNTDGTSREEILWSIGVEEGYYYSMQEWYFSISANAENISVWDANGGVYYRIENTSKDYKTIYMTNSEEIQYGKSYEFNITYDTAKNPVIYEPYHSYQRTVSKGSASEWAVNIMLPPNAEITKTEPIPQSIDHPSTYRVNYVFSDDGYHTIEIRYKITGEETLSLETVSSEHYELTAPSRYADFYTNLLNEADSAVSKIEEIYGFSNPYGKWNIEIRSLEDENFNGDTLGLFLGNNTIHFGSSHLRRAYQDILDDILHETMHGYNSVRFNGTSCTWWDEGTAQYINYLAQESIGYNITVYTSVHDYQVESCKMGYDLRNVSEWWYPYYGVNVADGYYTCDDESVSINILGYDYAEYVVRNLGEEYGSGLFYDFYKFVKDNNVKFSYDYDLMNNQMAYILSKSAGSRENIISGYILTEDMWADAESEISRTNNTLKLLERSYGFTSFSVARETLNKAFVSLYSGKFAEAENLAITSKNEIDKINSILEKISYINETLSVENYPKANLIFEFAVNEYENKSIDFSLNLLNNIIGSFEDLNGTIAVKESAIAEDFNNYYDEKLNEYRILQEDYTDNLNTRAYEENVLVYNQLSLEYIELNAMYSMLSEINADADLPAPNNNQQSSDTTNLESSTNSDDIIIVAFFVFVILTTAGVISSRLRKKKSKK